MRGKSVPFHFHFARTPDIIFGSGSISQLPKQIRRFAEDVLMITDTAALQASGVLDSVKETLEQEQIGFRQISAEGEPSPAFIDQVTFDLQTRPVQAVIAIGGGSTIDSGKAVSAMAGKKDSVSVYLEGVGNKEHDGQKLPFIAVPTTAGTGSEATKNAVLSERGAKGFKKSLRHDNLVPDIALIDPQLSLSCPAGVTAACGLDAFTQLLESYVSTKASPLTDALAYDGLRAVKIGLLASVQQGATNLPAREAMSYAALLSGITLANAGLGIVHGLASPMGGYTDIPHGVACGTLLAVATRITIRHLRQDGQKNMVYLSKYARVGRLLTDSPCEDVGDCCDLLLEKLDEWTNLLKLPRLSEFGYTGDLIHKIAAGSGNKNNPAELSRDEILEILQERL
jgi:alcohol dehydrogenase